ncbi:MAG: hydroxysqualene dehydroxylase HpnE [Hyphomicrobiales bacterium]|nr:hydroxysqualene dehydroxylase HpnE [Hyphomicrobiales bacterium]
MTAGAVHIVGAGLAGLSAATALVARGRKVVLYEAARMAGGRCRSYVDPQLNITLDNGNHLLLSGNKSAYAYLDRIGARDALTGPEECLFDFCDLRDGARWRMAPNKGRAPWWLLSKRRRTPGAGLFDYLAAARLLTAPRGAVVQDVLSDASPLWEKLWRPALVSALNTQPNEASAHLAAAVLRESFGAGGAASLPRVPRESLASAFVEPAISYLAARGAQLRFGARLRGLSFSGDRVNALRFGEEEIALKPEDAVIFAAPAWSAAEIMPQISVPTEHRGILNAHFAQKPPQRAPMITCTIGGLSEWVFALHDRLSVTISAADALIDENPATLAPTIWREVARAMNLGPAPMPPARIVKEKRATFAATPAQDALRPPPLTPWRNLKLAGDWTQTGLPATMEGAIRSGERAAALA